MQPTGFLGHLQEIGNIECDALTARSDEFPAIQESLDRLIARLKGAGIINPQSWEEFFGEVE